MQVTLFWPSLDLTVEADGIHMRDSDTGFEFFINRAAPFNSHTISQPSKLLPINTALGNEARYFRKLGPAPALLGSPGVIPSGSSSDWHDDSRGSHTTGGARRRYVSIGLARHLRGIADGITSLKSFARDQEPRPAGHILAYPFTYNGYYGRAADGWAYDQQDSHGWSVFDPSHLECSAIYSGMIAGDQECAAHMIALVMCVAAWIPGAGIYGPQKAWTGSHSERAVGEMIGFYARAALAGIGMGTPCNEFCDHFLGGANPKQHMIGLLTDLMAKPQPWGAGTVDGKTMPNIGTYNGRRELNGVLGWQNGIMIWWLKYALNSGLVNDPLKSQVAAWVKEREDELVDRAVTINGVSRAFSSMTDFTGVERALAQSLQTDPKIVYELLYGEIREIPRVPDSELTAGALYDSAIGIQLAALQKSPTDASTSHPTYADVATYLEPVWAWAEQHP